MKKGSASKLLSKSLQREECDANVEYSGARQAMRIKIYIAKLNSFLESGQLSWGITNYSTIGEMSATIQVG